MNDSIHLIISLPSLSFCQILYLLATAVLNLQIVQIQESGWPDSGQPTCCVDCFGSFLSQFFKFLPSKLFPVQLIGYVGNVLVKIVPLHLFYLLQHVGGHLLVLKLCLYVFSNSRVYFLYPGQVADFKGTIHPQELDGCL